MIEVIHRRGYGSHLHLYEPDKLGPNGESRVETKAGESLWIHDLDEIKSFRNKFEIVNPHAYRAQARVEFRKAPDVGYLHLFNLKTRQQITDGKGITLDDAKESFPDEFKDWEQSGEEPAAPVPLGKAKGAENGQAGSDANPKTGQTSTGKAGNPASSAPTTAGGLPGA